MGWIAGLCSLLMRGSSSQIHPQGGEHCLILLTVGGVVIRKRCNDDAVGVADKDSADAALPRLIDDAEGLDPSWLEGIRTVGLTAGASAPEELVDEVVKQLGDLGAVTFEKLAGVEERVQFKLPPQLTQTNPGNRKRA